MFTVDVNSAYVICGVGSLFGAATTALARVEEPSVRRAMRLCSVAFLVLGCGMTQVLMSNGIGSLAAQWAVVGGALIALALFGFGFAQLGGTVVGLRTQLVTVLLLGLAMAAAQRLGERDFGRVFCLLSTIISALMVLAMRKQLLRPANVAERVLAAALTIFLASWVLRTALSMADDTPLGPHLLHLSEPLRSVYAVYYGALPMMIATLLLNVVNDQLSARLHALAMSDELTGALTRRALLELAPAMGRLASREKQQVALLMLDLDHFKAVNDRYGHIAGDAVLRTFAACVKQNLRSDAIVCRYGGEEFAVIARVDSMHDARVLASRICERVAACRSGWAGGEIAVTVSIGVSAWAPEESLEAALKRADEALYRAKQAGRNQIQMSLAAAA